MPTPPRKLKLAAQGMGCPFYDRCPLRVEDVCNTHEPPWQTAADGGQVRCIWTPDELARRLSNERGEA